MNARDPKLVLRVNKAKADMRINKVSKESFFDDVYGALFYSERNRIDNLWACRVTEEDFTRKLEDYVSGKSYCTNVPVSEWNRFLKFVRWYTEKVGGMQLTEDEIEKTFPKFK